MKPDERGRILAMAESQDSRQRSAALTEAARVPPMPDPRIPGLEGLKRSVRKMERMFPDDPANEAIGAILPHINAAIEAVKALPAGQELARQAQEWARSHPEP